MNTDTPAQTISSDTSGGEPGGLRPPELPSVRNNPSPSVSEVRRSRSPSIRSGSAPGSVHALGDESPAGAPYGPVRTETQLTVGRTTPLPQRSMSRGGNSQACAGGQFVDGDYAREVTVTDRRVHLTSVALALAERQLELQEFQGQLASRFHVAQETEARNAHVIRVEDQEVVRRAEEGMRSQRELEEYQGQLAFRARMIQDTETLSTKRRASCRIAIRKVNNTTGKHWLLSWQGRNLPMPRRLTHTQSRCRAWSVSYTHLTLPTKRIV